MYMEMDSMLWSHFLTGLIFNPVSSLAHLRLTSRPSYVWGWRWADRLDCPRLGWIGVVLEKSKETIDFPMFWSLPSGKHTKSYWKLQNSGFTQL